MGRTNIVLQDDLVKKGLKLTGLKTKRELIDRALESFVRKQALKKFLKLRGKVRWEGNLQQMRRSRSWS